jgi:hypothetical protein
MWKIGFYFSACVTVLAVVESCERWFSIPLDPLVLGKQFWPAEVVIQMVLSYPVASRVPTGTAYLRIGLIGFLSAIMTLCFAASANAPSLAILHRVWLTVLLAAPVFAVGAGLLFWLLCGVEAWDAD